MAIFEKEKMYMGQRRKWILLCSGGQYMPDSSGCESLMSLNWLFKLLSGLVRKIQVPIFQYLNLPDCKIIFLIVFQQIQMRLIRSVVSDWNLGTVVPIKKFTN